MYVFGRCRLKEEWNNIWFVICVSTCPWRTVFSLAITKRDVSQHWLNSAQPIHNLSFPTFCSLVALEFSSMWDKGCASLTTHPYSLQLESALFKEVLRYIIRSSINIRPFLFPPQDNLTLRKDYHLDDRAYYSDRKVIGYTRYSIQFSATTTTHKHN